MENKTALRVWQGWVVAALLTGILILGAIFRLTGVDWDDHTHMHPDERFLTMVTSALSLPGQKSLRQPPSTCEGWGSYFDTACSPLNPYNYPEFPLFVYGTFPIFLTRVVGELVNQAGYDQIHLVGRVLSALFDLSTVLLIFLVGRRIYGWRVGLLGAFFLSTAVLDIQQSHFFTVDTFTNVPILIAFWFALDVAEGKGWPAFVAAGLAFGLALAGRINIAPFAAVLIAAAALRAYRDAVASSNARAEGAADARTLEDGPEPIPVRSMETEESERRVVNKSLGPVSISVGWREAGASAARSAQDSLPSAVTRAFLGLAAAALVALVVFRIAQPYAAKGPGFISPELPQLDLSRGSVNLLFDVALSWAGGVNPRYADNMTFVSELVSGKVDQPPGHQWTNRTPYVFPFENMVMWGLGLPVGLAAWAGFALALYHLLRYRHWQHVLVLVWVGITFAYTGQQFVKTMRYFLQIYPFLALLAGWLLVWLWDSVRAKTNPMVDARRWILQGATALFALVVIGYALIYASAFATIYTRPYTRVAASRWIFANIPVGSVIANEHWDDGLPLRVDGLDPYGGMYRGVPSSPDGQLQWYAEDTPEKREQAIHWLDDAQYIVLSSNRLYGSIPRLPMRYPMTTLYYQRLFDGTLGFEKVAEFTSRPQILGIEFNDDNAEEAFTVYDHPKVIIFKKTSQYSHAKTAALFNGVDLSEVYRFFPREATLAPTALLLWPADWQAQMDGGTWTQIFNPGDWINKIPVLGWLFMIELLGWILFPIAFVVFRGLADRGYAFSKAIGLLVPAWGAWMLGSYRVAPFSRQSILLVVLLVLLASAACLWLRRRELLDFCRKQRTLIAAEEVVFLGFFALDLLIRFGNPDLWHPSFGGEKPMDFAHFNAVLKSTWFPPYDPWFAGGFLNYYYFGQVINATLTRLSGIVPEVAYNLALPTYFGLTAIGAFSIVWNLITRWAGPVDLPAREGDGGYNDAAVSTVAASEGRGSSVRLRYAFAFLGAVFVALIGNLGQVMLIGQVLIKAGGGEPTGLLTMLTGVVKGLAQVLVDGATAQVPTHWWYWNASRVIPDTINEFPFFTFLYADLHAHLMAIPFTLVTIGVAINFISRGRQDVARMPVWPYLQISPTDILEVVVAAFVLGGLRAINLPDYITYLLVIACSLAIGEYARRKRIDFDGILAVGWRLIAVVILATVLYQPFVFATAYLSIELWKGKQTTLGEYLTVHGIFLYVIATYLLWQAWRQPGVQGAFRAVRAGVAHSSRLTRFYGLYQSFARPALWYQDIVVAVIVVLALLEMGLLLLQLYVFALILPLLALATLYVFHPSIGPVERFIALIVAAGLGLTLAVEVVVYKGDIGRMNTVFKFYVQVWNFFAIAAAAGLALIIGHQLKSARRVEPGLVPALPLGRSPVERRPLTGWLVGLGLLVLSGLAYPVLATNAKVNDRFVERAPAGLNGMDYMGAAVYHDRDQPFILEYDRQAIEWLRGHVEGSPVILEGNAPLYHWGSRVSIYTGLPTVIGWDWHQKQQRSIVDGAIIDRRLEDVRKMYDSRDVAEVSKLFKRFRVSYIYVGDLERAFYDAHGLAKFDEMTRRGELELVYQNDRVKIYKLSSAS